MTDIQKAQILKQEFNCIDEVENRDMDAGDFFVHLKSGYRYAPNGYGYIGSMSFHRLSDARKELKKVITE